MSDSSCCRPASVCICFTSTAMDRRKPISLHTLQHDRTGSSTCCCSPPSWQLPCRTGRSYQRLAAAPAPQACKHLRYSCRVGIWLPLTPPRWNDLSCATVIRCMVAVSILSPTACQQQLAQHFNCSAFEPLEMCPCSLCAVKAAHLPAVPRLPQH